MTNLAQSQTYTDEMDVSSLSLSPLPSHLSSPDNLARPRTQKTKTAARAKHKSQALSEEDVQIVKMIETLTKKLDYLHNCYDQTSDPLLVDSIIYELKATHMRYMYYLHLCKEKGIVSGL